MKQLNHIEVQYSKVKELGLNPALYEMNSAEVIAAILRKAGKYFCPCTEKTLVREVLSPLRGLLDDLDETKGLIEKTLEAMIAYGDFSESKSDGTNLLNITPASFTARKSGNIFLIGGTDSALPKEIESKVEYVNHVRRIRNPMYRSRLLELGFKEIAPFEWLSQPLKATPSEKIHSYDNLLDQAQSAGEISGLKIIDRQNYTLQYHWVFPEIQSGRFIGRRPRAYGLPIWCYVELSHGVPTRFIDLPTSLNHWRGCDEAWHLQMAIDANNGRKQNFRITRADKNSSIIQLFSPVPMWVKRRWDFIGTPVNVAGCLLSYQIRDCELSEELEFVKQELWLSEVSKERVL